MRFNDLLTTVLASSNSGASAAVTRWRQCVDLLAQNGDTPAEDDGHRQLLHSLGDLRASVTLSQRLASVVELGSRIRSPLLVVFLVDDHPVIVSATMARARLSDEAWAAIIPGLGPLGRSVLRRRGDLGERALGALAAFGVIDLSLPMQDQAALVVEEPLILDRVAPEEPVKLVAEEEAPEEIVTPSKDEPSEISKIVERIAEFRSLHPHPLAESAPEPPPEPAPPAIGDFQFTTDARGDIVAALGAPRSAAIGLSIGAPVVGGRLGADGQALGAFRRRAAFRDARFVIGAGHLAGEWRISADPRFEAHNGRFIGYVGTARRALAYEQSVQGKSATSDWGSLSPATARQLIHELRTPLNAIQGFAEIIEKQLFGPVSAEYREMATAILGDARQLLTTFDDLDLASRLMRGDATVAPATADLLPVLEKVIAYFDDAGTPPVVMEPTEPLARIDMQAEQAERMLMHLVRTARAASAPDETLRAALLEKPDAKAVEFRLEKPASLLGWSEDDLLEQGTVLEDGLTDGPPLGAAFSLRLVRSLAQHHGGRLDLEGPHFTLRLPAVSADAAEAELGA